MATFKEFPADQNASCLATYEEWRTIYFALSEYRDKLIDDLATGYNESPRYSNEDDMFLGETIGKVTALMFSMEQELTYLDAQANRTVFYKKVEVAIPAPASPVAPVTGEEKSETYEEIKKRLSEENDDE